MTSLFSEPPPGLSPQGRGTKFKLKDNVESEHSEVTLSKHPKGAKNCPKQWAVMTGEKGS